MVRLALVLKVHAALPQSPPPPPAMVRLALGPTVELVPEAVPVR